MTDKPEAVAWMYTHHGSMVTVSAVRYEAAVTKALGYTETALYPEPPSQDASALVEALERIKNARPAGDYVLVQEIETVTGDFCTEPGDPFYRIEIDGFCADFDYREAADNFAAAINARIAARPAVGEDVVERVVDAVIDAANIVSHDGYYEIDRDAATRAAIAAMGSADMGKGGEG